MEARIAIAGSALAAGAACCLAAGLHLFLLHLDRSGAIRISLKASTALLFLLMAAGSVVLWSSGNSYAQGYPSLQWGSLGLYGAGCIIYLEMRSLLSRGYSIRILHDLFERGPLSMEELQSSYGSGMGIKGIMEKRLKTLAQLHLIHFEIDRTGSLTFLGWICGKAGNALRKLLNMEEVG